MGIRIQPLHPPTSSTNNITTMNSKTFIKKINKIIKKRLSKKIAKKTEEVVMYIDDVEEDNSANEALEAELMALLASANPHPEQETVTIQVPASPDHLTKSVTITTGSQSAQPQTHSIFRF